ncbi:hypothetical protein [Streptomyces sp. NPDC050504]|uniref:hypothetical protein n=1 Tax=Streptomyces sp. NPDC050504 TaxID=3365618 RepID=UPI0037AE1072
MHPVGEEEPGGGGAPRVSRAAGAYEGSYAVGRGDAPVPDPAQVDPAVLGALLGRHGWRRRGGAAGRYTRWTPPPGAGAGGPSLLVPENRTYPDSEELLGEALTALLRCGVPAAREVLVSLAVPSDEVRWWRDVPPGPAGAADWAGQDELRAAARQMLLAAALAVRGRAGYYGVRHRRQAQAALEGVLVGGAEDVGGAGGGGSGAGPGGGLVVAGGGAHGVGGDRGAFGGRGLTAFVPVGAGGRAVTVRLYQALHAARDAVDYRRATGGMEAFDAAVGAGVSRELTEAVVALVRGSEGARIAMEWAPAAGVPRECAARPAPVEFSPGDLPALREAGARYLQDEPAVAVRITGAVVRMRRSGPKGPGTVRLRVLAGVEVPHVRVELDEEAYRTAGHAHLVGVPIRVVGRLESRGGFRRLTDASQVVPVPVDEVERDRLMKSLQENLDFFGEVCGAGE